MKYLKKCTFIYCWICCAHRFKNTYTELSVPTKTIPQLPNDWLSFLSKGNCIYPSTSFLEAAQIMNHEFEKFHGNFFNQESKIFDKLTDIVCKQINYKFPEKVIACLVRTRTYMYKITKHKSRY